MSRLALRGPAAWLASAFLAVALAVPLAAARSGDVSVSAYNGRYSQPGVAFDGVRLGPLVVRLSSPENALFVDRHQVQLSPLGDGLHAAELTAAVRGGGRLVADVEVAGAPSRMTDDVVLPPQTVTVEGRARLARVDGGYEIALVELPPSVGVEIESALADQLVVLCDGLQILALGALDCSAVERSLRVVQVPLPASGETLFLADGQLTADERTALERYLESSSQASIQPAPSTRIPTR